MKRNIPAHDPTMDNVQRAFSWLNEWAVCFLVTLVMFVKKVIGITSVSSMRIDCVRNGCIGCVLHQPILTRHVTRFFFFFQQKRLSLKPLTLSPFLSLLSSPDLSISGSNLWPPWLELQSSTQATNTTIMAETPQFNNHSSRSFFIYC